MTAIKTGVLAALALGAATSVAAADFSYSTVDAGWARTDIDDLNENGDGFFLRGSVGFGTNWFAAAGYRQVSFDVGGNDVDFDLIDAHYYYPDGVAAAILSRVFNRPFIVTARGTDINLISNYAWPRKLMLDAADQASASISVCRALRDEIERMGAAPARLHVLRNGVDLQRFHPVPQAEARAALGWPARKTILSVGLLIERKGHYLIIEALKDLPDFDLVIAGDGPDRRSLEELAKKLQVADRVRFAGSVPQVELYRYYSAADVLILASSREGWANVLLESMACGTPVVATRIWGTPEVVAAPEAGRLADERTAASLAAAVRTLMAEYPERAAVRRYAERFSWTETTQGQLEIFRNVVGQGG